MTDNTLSVSMLINAPVERVWLLLIEQQQSSEQDMLKQKYFQSKPEGPLVAGQVIHIKQGPLHVTTYINRIIPADPPFDGQTIYVKITFLGKEGEGVSHWFRDVEHHHMQVQSELNHPWCTFTEQTNIRCIAIDTTSCVIVYVEQSEMTFRLMPRWLKQKFNNDKTTREAIAKMIETSLQNIKEKAEWNFNRAL